MKLIKGTYYRITETWGKKWKGTFEEEINYMGRDCLRFSLGRPTERFTNHLTIQVSLIKLIEEADETTVEQQAKDEDRLDEYEHYGYLLKDVDDLERLDDFVGTKRRTKFNYRIVYRGGE